jgi:hypothetical protein
MKLSEEMRLHLRTLPGHAERHIPEWADQAQALEERVEKAEAERDALKALAEDAGHCEAANAIAKLVDERDEAVKRAEETGKALGRLCDVAGDTNVVECAVNCINEDDGRQELPEAPEDQCVCWGRCMLPALLNEVRGSRELLEKGA